MARKQQSPSKASIRASLLDGLFDPRDRTPMSVVVGMNDPNYGESKAIELITEAKIIAKRLKDDPKLKDEYREKMAQAMSLIALCKVQRDGAAEDA